MKNAGSPTKNEILKVKMKKTGVGKNTVPYDKQPTKVPKWVKRLQNVLLQNLFGFWVSRTDTHLVSNICLRCHNVTAKRTRVNVSPNFLTYILQYRGNM